MWKWGQHDPPAAGGCGSRGGACGGGGCWSMWEVYPGGSIQDAIGDAGEGDTIYVHVGEYCENVDVGKRLTLPVLAPSVDVGLTPDDDPAMPGVQVINPDYLTTNRTVAITADVTDPDCYENITSVIADITGADTVGESPVSLTFTSNSSATTARYTGRFNMSSHPVCDYAVVVNATNAEGFTGTSSKSFAYLHEATAHLLLSPFIIYGYVPYTNGSACNSPFVVVTNLNTSEELIADNQTGESFYQLVTSSAFVKAGDVLKINASKNGSPVGNVTHTVNQTDIEHGAIEVNINKELVDAPDFTVTDVSFDPSEPLIGDLVTINATIANTGAAGGASVEICDNKSIWIARETDNTLVNDTITLPDSLRIRVHFVAFCVYGNITIHNETQLVEKLPITEIGMDHWTEWCDGGTIRIESLNAWFIVDRYEAVLANESITLGAGNSTSISAVWNLSDQYTGWVTNGTHDITIKVDPYNQVVESNKTNNNRTETIDVHPSLDFAVTNISFNNNEPVLGEVVGINATIFNYGVRNGTTVVEVYYDNISTGDVLIAEEPVTLNATESKVISASWLTGAACGGVGDHNITAGVYPPDAFAEANKTNNTLKKQLSVNGTDLTVTRIEIPCGLSLDNLCYVGQDVPVNVTIANFGAADATNFTVKFRNGACSGYGDANRSGTDFSEVHIERLNSSKSRNISVIWNPAETGWHTITASIPYDKCTDNNGTNNELFGFSCVEPRYDFLVESVNVTPQDGVRRGESVDITATICNIGQGGGNVSIAFFVNSTDYAGTCGERFTRIGTIDDVYVEVGETVTVSIIYDVDMAGGCHLTAAAVNPDNEIDEIYGTIYDWGLIRFRGNTGNNVKTCTLQVIPNDLDITGITIDPAEPNIGDLVNVSATIRNNGSAEAESMVWLYVEENVAQPTHGLSSWSTHQQPEDAMIRVHFNYIKWGWAGAGHPDTGGYWNGNVRAYVNGSYGQRKQIYFYYKDTEGEMVKVPYIDKSMPCTESKDFVNPPWKWRHWYDVWTEWSYGDKIEISLPTANTNPGWISIDCYQVRLGNSTVTLRPGESMAHHGSWNASLPIRAGEYYRLMASVDDQKRYSNETYLGGTDLAITNLSVTPVALDGDRVWINATIENFGRIDATDVIVNFTEVYRPEEIGLGPWGQRRNAADHPELIDTTHVEGLDVGNSIHISVLWNASIREIECDGGCWDGNPDIHVYRPCSWAEIADDYIINVTINPLESMEKEENNTNNTEVAGVHVDSSRDFEVTKLSFLVNNESHDPSELLLHDDVTLNVTLNITNLVNQCGMVNVSFCIDEASDEHEIGNTSVSFPVGNGTGYAEIEWKVENFDGVDITGEHNMTVVVDPENRIYEIDDVNNTYTQPIYVMASEDLVLESLCVNPESPVKGDGAYINVTITNVGKMNASDVILIIYDWAERHIEDVDEQSRSGQIEITREDAAAMRLYLDLEVDGGRVCIDDGSGGEIICYHQNFHGWTPWVLDNSTTIVVTDGAYARVSKVYHLASGSIIDTSTHDIGINETTNVTVNWDVSVGGERFIAAIIDPEDCIIESDEFNNRLVEFVSVQTADLLVSNLSLAWLNGTEIGENEIIKHGDDVRIAANITNIGVEDATEFDIRFLVDDIPIEDETIPCLAIGSTIPILANWSATVGSHVIKVEADYENELNETNETNNIASLERYVRGPELSGNTSWETLGLHGEILFEPDQPYDEDKVNITATINNSGYMPAENFSAALFFDYKPLWYRWVEWGNISRPGAVCVYLDIVINSSDLTLTICDGDGNEVKKTDRSCWVQVPGDVVDVSVHAEWYGDYKIYPYPVYPDNLSQITELDVNSSVELPPITHNVSTGDYPIMLFIDPEGKVPEDEDHREDNIISRIMHVKPTRDFTVTNITAAWTNLSDLDTPTITADVANIGLRNGTAEVTFVDYEEEMRTYKYHFDPNQTLSYLPIPPDAELLKSGYDGLTIIHCPGVDAIEDLCFRVCFEPKTSGAIISSVYDENDAEIWSATGSSFGGCENANIASVSGETAYIYTNRASFSLGGYTTKKEFHREGVALNATKTWNESKNITPMWTAYTGDHTIVGTLDKDDRITEINESNNANSNLFHVNASRDPAIAGINSTPEHPGDGDDVDITAVITNRGYKSASFTVDLWANLTRDKPGADESVPDVDLTTDLGGDRIRYITLLKHADLTLAPGENTTVNATWNDISIAGSPTHHIIAIVDPTDEIDEINESNNEINKEIFMSYLSYPDLTIGGCYVPGGNDNAVVTIRECGGICGASDVTVRFESYETEGCNEGCGQISHPGASNIQVYFDYLYALDGHVEVRDSLNLAKPPIATYSGVELAGVWSPWVGGDTVYIVCQGTGTYANITKYNWGNVSDEQIDDLPAGGSEHVEIPWAYECPRNVHVRVDPDNNIAELNEDNNEKSVLIYADLRAERIEFVSPRDTMLSLDADKFVIDGYIANKGYEDGVVFPVSDFDVTLEFRNRYPNGTVGDLVFDVTEHVEEPLYANEDRAIRFEFDPSEELEVGGNYVVFLIADSAGDVCESNDLYPSGEYNNVTSMNIYVYNSSGYTGGSNLTNVAQGEVHGRVVYTIGDSRYTGLTPPGGAETVRYTGVIPDDACDKVELARIFVYWYAWHNEGGRVVPVLADVNVTFNGHSLTKAGNYSDNSGATTFDYGYGMYSYDVTGYVTSGENVATVKNNAEWNMGIHAIGLLMVYGDEDEPLTKYWINEGADIMMAANGMYPTGLPGDDCITNATFDGVEREDTDNVNAALLTVLGVYRQYGESVLFSGEGDALRFNNQSIGSLIGTGYWECQNPAGIALTANGWDDVTDYLKHGANLAEIRSKGNFMMPNNAFLRLIFPPDINITNLTALDSIVVGKEYPINVTIRNDGRSDAHDFNITLCIDGKQMIRIPHLDLPAGESTTIHLYNWTPMMLGHVYNLTVTADILSGEDWTEVEADNNGVTIHVPNPPSGAGTFDTGSGTYPSICGVHRGNFTPKRDIFVHRMYTYPCKSTGGHSEYVAFYYENGSMVANGTWSGYRGGDYHNIEFDAPFTLHVGVVYNYEIKTGSYPQIIHRSIWERINGTITCTEFIDANGKRYADRIPAIRLE